MEEPVQVKKDLLFDILSLSSYLAIEDLYQVGCNELGKAIQGKNVDEMREFFKVTNDFEEEEERRIAKEMTWTKTRDLRRSDEA
ncbi:S-phase kinase-associated protein 1A [Lasiosphaeria hispida]|uniref:S-phase kinase-associated protein 1A n=1 Tax=Lasiosphaeria hispida TaxID=260671 RepID=A0AAJ0MB21_9PEZI|nr:S-phase kinase-associated protein 1A [Lasiosphaeria hispida]